MIHWKNWEFICQPKLEGGMGFWSLSISIKHCKENKHGCYFSIQNLLLSRVEDTFVTVTFLPSSLGHTSSLTCLSILWGQELLYEGLWWKWELNFQLTISRIHRFKDCRRNISSANEILIRGIKSERRLFAKHIKTNRFIKMIYQNRTE